MIKSWWTLNTLYRNCNTWKRACWYFNSLQEISDDKQEKIELIEMTSAPITFSRLSVLLKRFRICLALSQSHCLIWLLPKQTIAKHEAITTILQQNCLYAVLRCEWLKINNYLLSNIFTKQQHIPLNYVQNNVHTGYWCGLSMWQWTMNMLAILNRREIFSQSIPFTVLREGIVQGKPHWHTWKKLETGDFKSITPDRADSYDASATVSRERIWSWVEAIGRNFDSHCSTTSVTVLVQVHCRILWWTCLAQSCFRVSCGGLELRNALGQSGWNVVWR